MSKWEDQYEEYKNGSLDDRITELKDKVDKRTAKSEEMKEYEKKLNIKNKLPEVKNILEYRDKLKEELYGINTEIATRNTLEEANKKKMQLEIELVKLQKEYDNAIDVFNHLKPTEKNKEQIEEKKAEIREKINQNNNEYVKQEEILKSALGDKRPYLELTQQQMEKKKIELSSKVSKCNMVAKNLLNGLSWDSIDMKLDNWKDRKFTAKDVKAIENSKEEGINPVEVYNNNKEDTYQEYPEDPMNYDSDLRFSYNHPRLAKIRDFFRNSRIGKLFKNIKNKLLLPEGKKQEKTELENPKPEEPKKEKDSFKDEIKVVAKVGYKDARKEQLKNNKELRARYEAMKEANRKNEEEKFGKKYADMSRDTDEGR